VNIALQPRPTSPSSLRNLCVLSVSALSFSSSRHSIPTNRFSGQPLGASSRLSLLPFKLKPSTFSCFSVSPFPAALTSPLQTAENPATLSCAFATLTGHASHKSFVCHSCRKTPGGGVPLRARIFLSYPKASHLTAPPPEIFSWVRCTENMDQSSTKPCVSLPGPDVPRGAL
jgi:hypothetical protein